MEQPRNLMARSTPSHGAQSLKITSMTVEVDNISQVVGGLDTRAAINELVTALRALDCIDGNIVEIQVKDNVFDSNTRVLITFK